MRKVTINGEQIQSVTNQMTGNEEVPFNATLISISTAVLENKNGNPYRVATGEFVNADGEIVKRSFIVHEKNFAHGMEIGNQYLSKVIFDANQPNPLLVMSHLQGNAVRATYDDFGFTVEELEQEVFDELDATEVVDNTVYADQE